MQTGVGACFTMNSILGVWRMCACGARHQVRYAVAVEAHVHEPEVGHVAVLVGHSQACIGFGIIHGGKVRSCGALEFARRVHNVVGAPRDLPVGRRYEPVGTGARQHWHACCRLAARPSSRVLILCTASNKDI
jgi:hypothetical protein